MQVMLGHVDIRMAYDALDRRQIHAQRLKLRYIGVAAGVRCELPYTLYRGDRLAELIAIVTGVAGHILSAFFEKDKKIDSTNTAFISAFANAEIKVKPLTLTLDNGTEFLGFKDLEKSLNLKVFFADSHAPWQRGSNENVNGLVRFFFPRGTDFNKVTQEQLNAVVSLINNRPRKCLGFLSPNEYLKKVLHLA